MPHALALSPHLDDAAFSCGGTLAWLAGNGWRVTVCTAFTRSVAGPTGFALACQLDKNLPPGADYMAIRRAEDAVACARLGADPLWLDYPEAPHRGYPDAAALFGAVPPEDTVHAALANTLGLLLAPPPDLLLAPQAIGGHVDHVQIVRAVRRVLAPQAAVWWWTDFPYAMRPTAPTPFGGTMEALPTVELLGDAPARHSACTAYATQLGFQFGGPEGLAAALAAAGASERFRRSGPVPATLRTWIAA